MIFRISQTIFRISQTIFRISQTIFRISSTIFIFHRLFSEFHRRFSEFHRKFSEFHRQFSEFHRLFSEFCRQDSETPPLDFSITAPPHPKKLLVTSSWCMGNCMTASIKIQSRRLERREIDFKRKFTTNLETLKRNFKKNPLILKKYKNIFLRKLLLVIRRDSFENI